MSARKRVSPKERSAINRENGRKSRGPKTGLGRSRSSQNARRHGLSIAVSQDPVLSPAIEELAFLIAGDGADKTRLGISRQIAEAQMDLLRIREARASIWADESLRRVIPTVKKFRDLSRLYKSLITHARPDDDLVYIVEQCDKAVEALSNQFLPPERGLRLIIGRLDALERYERRALSKRNKALHDLTDYDEQRALGLPWP